MDASENPAAPRMFTVPVAGTYHFGRTAEPHLVSECTDACRDFGGSYVAEPGEIRSVELVTVPAADL